MWNKTLDTNEEQHAVKPELRLEGCTADLFASCAI